MKKVVVGAVIAGLALAVAGFARWTVIGREGRFTFPNPQSTLYDRVAALRQLVRDEPSRTAAGS